MSFQLNQEVHVKTAKFCVLETLCVPTTFASALVAKLFRTERALQSIRIRHPENFVIWPTRFVLATLNVLTVSANAPTTKVPLMEDARIWEIWFVGELNAEIIRSAFKKLVSVDQYVIVFSWMASDDFQGYYQPPNSCVADRCNCIQEIEMSQVDGCSTRQCGMNQMCIQDRCQCRTGYLQLPETCVADRCNCVQPSVDMGGCPNQCGTNQICVQDQCQCRNVSLPF